MVLSRWGNLQSPSSLLRLGREGALVDPQLPAGVVPDQKETAFREILSGIPVRSWADQKDPAGQM